MNKIITWVIGIVAVLSLIISIGNSVGGNNQPVLGGITNYDSLRIDALGVGTDPVVATAESIITGTGTSTVKLNSSTSGKGGCIEMKTTNGSTTKIYLSATTTVLTITEGTCK
jgi:hypothetical protein